MLRVLLERRAAGSTPGERRDGHRVALVIGGGGMRGSYVAGMLRAVERAGLTAPFDEVYGASSGSFTAAAFLTGDAAACAACYPDDLCTRVVHRHAPAAAPAARWSTSRAPGASSGGGQAAGLGGARAHAGRLHVVATDVADLTADTLTGMEPVADWKRALRASATIPLLAGPPVEWAGRRWVDGSVAEPLAMARALRGGATHVLVMLCRGADDLHHDADAGLSLWARTLDRLVPGLGTVAQGSRRYGVDLRLVIDGAHPAAARAPGRDRPGPLGRASAG